MNEEKIIQKLIENDERLVRIEENMVTKKEFLDFKNEFLNGQDHVIKILKRLDEERIFTIEWVKRIEADLENMKTKVNSHETELVKVKERLNIQ